MFITPIYWYSSSTIVGIDEQGNINILDFEGIYHVELYAVIRVGNEAEYCTMKYVLTNEPGIEPIVEVTTNEETPEIIDEIKIEVDKSETNHNDMIYLSYETSETVELESYYEDYKEIQKGLLEKESTNNYHYEAIAVFHAEISEVILWRILSCEPLWNTASNNAHLNLNIYQINSRKGEKI